MAAHSGEAAPPKPRGPEAWIACPESLAAGCKIYKVLYRHADRQKNPKPAKMPTGKKTPNPQKWRQPVCLRLRARSALRPSRTPR
jgi:hypothetical protein